MINLSLKFHDKIKLVEISAEDPDVLTDGYDTLFFKKVYIRITKQTKFENSILQLIHTLSTWQITMSFVPMNLEDFLNY